MTRVYAAGPMTGMPGFNFEAFHAAARRLRGEGFEVENPAENPDPPSGAWRDYLRMAMAQLVTCDELRLLPGWRQSKGARLEAHIARELGLPIEEIAP